jgi:signal transduction histidine kinase
MQAILSVIREKRRTPTEYEQALDDLVEEADRLRALTENLLLLARGGNRWAASREVVNLSLLLCDVVESLRPLAEARGLSLACATPDDLVVLGDMDGLIRLFWNLVDNAIKYTRQGSITVSAEQQDGSTVSVLVTDTGPGISPEHLPHVFDRFYRVGESRTTPGAGLGLAIAQEIARAHGGSIEVTSIAGKGSTFVVHLPLRPDESAAL